MARILVLNKINIINRIWWNNSVDVLSNTSMYCVLEMSAWVNIVPPVRVPRFEVNFCSRQIVQLQHYCFTVAKKDWHNERSGCKMVDLFFWVSLLPQNDSSEFEAFRQISFEKFKKTAVWLNHSSSFQVIWLCRRKSLVRTLLGICVIFHLSQEWMGVRLWSCVGILIVMSMIIPARGNTLERKIFLDLFSLLNSKNATVHPPNSFSVFCWTKTSLIALLTLLKHCSFKLHRN